VTLKIGSKKLFYQPSENITVYRTVAIYAEIYIFKYAKNGKAPDDEIVSECLKKGDQGLLNQLYKLINIIWEQEKIPEAWHISVYVLYIKKETSCKIIEESYYSTI